MGGDSVGRGGGERRLPGPVLAGLVALVALSAVALLGLVRLEIDDDLRALFNGTDPRFEPLSEVGERFGLGETVLVVLEGDVLSRRGIASLRRMEEELFLLDRVESFDSILSTRSLADRGGDLPPLWPEPDASDERWRRATQEAARHPLLRGRTVSEKCDLTLALVRLAADPLAVGELVPLLEEIERVVLSAAAEEGLAARLTGFPALRAEIVRSIFRDQVIFQLLGGLVGVSVAWLLLRRLAWMVIAAAGPILGMAWALGAIGLLGYPIDVLNNVVAPLVLVLGFADSMHLAFCARRRVAAGDPRVVAAAVALRTVGPACLLTSLTTGLALLSLALSEAEAIRRFAFSAALGCGAVLVAVAISVPTLVSLLPRRWLRLSARRDPASGLLRRWHAVLVPRAAPVAVASAVLVLFLLALTLRIEADYRYRENLPAGKPAVQAAERLDEKLGGSSTLQVWMRHSQGLHLDDSELAVAFQRVEETIAAVPIGLAGDREGGFGAPLSLLTVLQSLGEDLAAGERAELLAEAPPEVLSRLRTPDAREHLVHARMPDVGARRLAPALAELQSRLDLLREEMGAEKLEITGLAALSAAVSPGLIGELLDSLLLAGLAVFVLLAIGLRSCRLALIGVIPNLLPLVAVTGLLVLLGRPVLYGTVLALTVALGIAVDDTVHLLAGYRRARRDTCDASVALARAFVEVGPVLITTTVILVAGLLAVLASAMPTVRHFGVLSSLALSLALIADLVVLPAILISTEGSGALLAGLRRPLAAASSKLFRRLRKRLETACRYRVVSQWRVEAGLPDLAAIVQHPENLEHWWSSVFLQSRCVAPPGPDGRGGVYWVHTKGWAPHTMCFFAEVTDAGERSLRLETWGDFEGEARVDCELVPGVPSRWTVRMDWRIRVHKPYLVVASLCLKPLLIRNHQWAVAQGELGLRRHLAQRRMLAGEVGARAVPPTLQPTWPHNLRWVRSFYRAAVVEE